MYDRKKIHSAQNFTDVSFFFVVNTPNTMVNCIGALVQQRDDDTSAIWMIDMSICNLKI